ncbi:hypothetical protein MAC_06849 [Metarhizium acridum CQMa 102]|uniref:Uncharacterized protein n=1 Tax=Metarhizium acridum (strain CQMa 102) TaxID=655827 RepID=E9EAF1_METAQ|nr:uncharacterized protein MAC_06849 [Metarhizium acridum CQMa 102]EFY87060.1 hypothetical protein MAC_06849 [Metarhizium acridum CQMa 102]
MESYALVRPSLSLNQRRVLPSATIMIITFVSTATARVILRVYFIVCIAATAWLSKIALHILAKIVVARRRTVFATSVIGSLDGLDLVLTSFRLRRLAGGTVGFSILLLLFLLGKAADVLTAYLVVSKPVKDRCWFGQGLVFNDSMPDIYSQVNGRPVAVLQNAQVFAVNNTCPYGIYKKVNLDPSFCPDDSDIIGSWKCETTASLTLPAGTSNVTIINDLVSKKMLYTNWFDEYSDNTGTGSNTNHLVAWSTSAAANSDGSDWGVLAAVQKSWEPDEPVQLDALKCTLNAPGATNTARSMASLYDLRVWAPMFQGLMYWGTNTPAVGNVAGQLAMLLNTMIMISGGRNYLLATPGARQDQTQGCVKPAAYVPPTMIAIFLFVLALFVLSLLAFLILSLWFRILKGNLPEGDIREIETVPQDVLEWALLAARGHSLGPRVPQPGAAVHNAQDEGNNGGEMEELGPANHGENDLAAVNGANMDLPLIQEGPGAPVAGDPGGAGDGAGVMLIEARELGEFRIGFERVDGEGRTVGIFRRAGW